MALTDALYAPVASFEQAQPRAFERALSQPPEDFDTTGDSTANLILCSRQGADATHEALDRTSVVVRRGAWPDMFEAGASERQSGTKLRTKGELGNGFSKPPAAAFDACFLVGGDDKSSVQARRPADEIEQVTLEAKEPRRPGKAGSSATGRSDSDAADLGWIGDIFEDM